MKILIKLSIVLTIVLAVGINENGVAQIQSIKKSASKNKKSKSSSKKKKSSSSSSSSSSYSSYSSSSSSSNSSCGCSDIAEIIDLFTVSEEEAAAKEARRAAREERRAIRQENREQRLAAKETRLEERRLNLDTSRASIPDIYNYNLQYLDPSLISLDLKALSALSFEPSSTTGYTYVNFLPGARLSIYHFYLEFRNNILTEYTNDFPDSYKTWDLSLSTVLYYNPYFKLSFGMGYLREQFTESGYHEYIIGAKLRCNQFKDYFDIDTRLAVDYQTNTTPFFETGLNYNKRFLNSGSISGYITLGFVYQNYYKTHDIYGFKGGITINLHGVYK